MDTSAKSIDVAAHDAQCAALFVVELVPGLLADIADVMRRLRVGGKGREVW